MAASGAPVRQPRRGPAPIASFDHDGSDESSPETKQTFRLPEIVEDSSSAAGGDALAPPEQRTRSHSTPCAGAGALGAPPAPRIDISRASSSSHQDSRDSSPELALFAGAAPAAAEGLGFREDGALDLRSSTEELAFLEPAPAPPPPPARRHSRKDSQGSEAALLAVSGRTSRLSSVGSQCSATSAHSALSGLSRVSRLSVASGASRSPSPHRMLLETSFCGPKPIETDPEACAAAVEERLLEMAKLSAAASPIGVPAAPVAPAPPVTVVVAVTPAPAPVDARDRREVRTEATVERAVPRPPAARTAPAPAPAPVSTPVTAPPVVAVSAPALDEDKRSKETKNRVRAEERRARSRERRDDSGESRTKSRSKDIIRIRLKPSEEYDDDDEDNATECAASGSAPKPVSLELGAAQAARTARPTDFEAVTPAPRRPRDSRTPSPAGAVASRKSSFCSLFKSRETIASPESPSDVIRRKKSLNEGRSRSRSRDRSVTPTSATKIKGSVLSLFKTPRKSATSPSPSSREGSPVVQPQRAGLSQPPRPTRGEKLKYYDDAKDGIIHIPLRTPPDEAGASRSEADARPASAPQQRVPISTIGTSVGPSTSSSSGGGVAGPSGTERAARALPKPIQRTVLPDGSIIIPLRSPTEKTVEDGPLSPPAASSTSYVQSKTTEESQPAEQTSRSSSTAEVASVASPGPGSASSALAAASPGDATAGPSGTDATPSPDPPPEAPVERARSRRERLIFTTHVGSAEQVFCTQFSITKTPSVTSEISGSFASFPDVEEPPPPTALRESKIARSPSPPAGTPRAPAPSPGGASPQDAARDSSESEASSEAAPARGGNDVERRGLVVQESFEDELPYVPTTLPQERSLALPMVPVRERGGVRVAPVQRPRSAAARPGAVGPRAPSATPSAPPVPPITPAPRAPPTEDKIRIKLPRRPRTASASAAPPRPERTRARSGSDGMETRPKAEWIDFSEVPERRKQPKRIQTLPAAAAAGAGAAVAAGGGRDVVFSYVEPEECRCECHARADDETPLLDDSDPRIGTSPAEEAAAADGGPFTGDLELSRDPPTTQEGAGGAGGPRQ